MATFTYEELDSQGGEIRLLRIAPSEDAQAPINTELVYVPLSRVNTYEALSYTWGERGPSEFIYVSGSKFAVTNNLHQALRALRRRIEERMLWVDAICINQENEREKSREILRMYSIYKRATQVIVWLGPEKSDTMIAMNHLSILSYEWTHQSESAKAGPSTDLLSIMSRFVSISACSALELVARNWPSLMIFSVVLYMRKVSEKTIYYPSPWSGIPAFLLRACYVLFDIGYMISTSIAYFILAWSYFTTWTQVWRLRVLPLDVEVALLNFFGQPWFRRTWILQEIAANKNVVIYCGDCSILWSTLRESLERMQDVVETSFWKHPYEATYFQDAAFISVGLDRDVPEPYRSSKRSLAYLLGTFSHLSASNPRDKVYGLLGLAQDLSLDRSGQMSSQYRPNYHLSVKQVFAKSVKQCIEATGCLDVLRAVHDAKILTDLPSWVPDWTASRVPHISGLVHWREPFSIPGLEQDRLKIAIFSADMTSLKLRGFVVGVIKAGAVFDLRPEYLKPFLSIWNVMVRISRVLDPLFQRPVSDMKTTGGLNNTLSRLGRPSVRFDQIGQDFNFYVMVADDANRLGRRIRRSILFPADPQSLLGYTTAPGRTAVKMRTFEWAPTQERFDGFGSSVCTHVSAKPGDFICMFLGAKVPFLVRHTGNEHRLLGSVTIGGSRVDDLIWRKAASGHLERQTRLDLFTLT